MIGLTARQRELLVYLSERKTCPTFREMGRALGYSEKNLTTPIWQLLNALEARGYIRRLPNCARAIEVLRPLPSPRLRVVYGPDHWKLSPEERERARKAA